MSELKQHTKNTIEMPAFGLKVTDIYYVLFRQKWIVAGFFGAGLIAALIVFFAQGKLYWSEAKLLVRYVIDTKSLDPGMGTQVKEASYGGESIINSELEILTSFDLCEEVAALVGPEKILKESKATNGVTAAAVAIYRGLSVENPRRSGIIKVRFVHPDPAVPEAVLRQLIESYFKRHKFIHRSASQDNQVLLSEKDKLLGSIRAYEKELSALKSTNGIISLDDFKRGLADQSSRLSQEIFAAQAQLAEYRAILGRAPFTATNEEGAANVSLPPEKVTEYKAVCSRLELLRSKEVDLSLNLTEENPQVKLIRDQVAEVEKRKKNLETEYPKLVGTYSPQPVTSPSGTDVRPDPSRLNGLEVKIKVLSNQLASVVARIKSLEGIEGSILDVERKLKLDQETYMHVASGLAAAEFDEVLMAGKNMSNIRRVQEPSPSAPNVSQRLKAVAGTFSGLLIAGIVLAFIIEMLLDHTVRRPGEFESKMQMPLFLSIPKFDLNGHSDLLPLPAHVPEPGAENELQPTWATGHPLRPYIDGLRDRTLIHFEGDPHKPKLIGVTSCGEGVGVTSLAAGLAGALSETGDGNVLLLNLNFESQSVHPFYGGELTCGLSDALEMEKRRNSAVLQNLYVATASDPSDAGSQNLSKQLARVVPRLRVSDYDYIIFDLPPTTPTTMTARLAGMMDLVILVVESEKDTQEGVKQVGRLLSRSKARVSAVLNKVRNPIPLWLNKST